MRVVCSIQARLNSSRFPRKVLAPLGDRPLLLKKIERIKRSRLVDRVIVATSANKLDDEIVNFCDAHSIECFRGPENDVLARIASLLRQCDEEIHVECYGDSPLVDPQIIDEFIGYLLKNFEECDYVSSSIKTTYPPGLEVNVYKKEILVDVDARLPKGDPLREHAAYNITRFADRYKIHSLEAPDYLKDPELYLEVDTQSDYELLNRVIEHFKGRGIDHFNSLQIIELFKAHPEWKKHNNTEDRRWRQFRQD